MLIKVESIRLLVNYTLIRLEKKVMGEEGRERKIKHQREENVYVMLPTHPTNKPVLKTLRETRHCARLVLRPKAHFFGRLLRSAIVSPNMKI